MFNIKISSFYINKKGFSLIEALIYISIIGIAGTFLIGLALNVLKIQSQNTSSSEVTQQLNFVLQNIQRHVRDSSLVQVYSGANEAIFGSRLVLRMQDDSLDPTQIYSSNGKIYLKEGENYAILLTEDSVIVDSLIFKKTSNYPGHDLIQIDLMMTYASNDPAKSFSKSLSSAVARVNAATFDSNLIPGAGNSYDFGLSDSSARWRNGYFSQNLLINGSVGINTDSPASSAALEINSVTKGFLPPRMTTAERDAITSPVQGLTIFNTVTNKLNSYNGSSWQIEGGFWAANGNDISNTNSGNVGIGIANPSQKLVISGSGTQRFYITDTESGTMTMAMKAASTYGTVGTELANDLRLQTNATDRITILSAGNVGISTTTPSEKLDISGGNGRIESGYNWLTTSDVRFKKNITTYENALSKILAIRGVRYDLIEDTNIIDGQGKYIGFIAQELEQQFPEIVITDSDGKKAIAYDKMTAILVEALKEQQKQIDELKQTIDSLKK